jgi:oligopeptidase B
VGRVLLRRRHGCASCGCMWVAVQMPYEPSFKMDRLVLLDRGFVFAIAHIRGGGDMGRGW